LVPLLKCEEGERYGDRHLVLFKPETAPDTTSVEAIAGWAAKEIGGANVKWAYSFAEFFGFAATFTPEQLSALRAHPLVDLIEEDCIMRILPTEVGTPFELVNTSAPAGLPGWAQYRHNQNTATFTTTKPISLPDYGANTIVYVIDTGTRHTHQEFGNRCRPTTSFVTGENTDGNGHGTHCAGTVAGANAGYASQGQIHPVKVLANSGSGSTADVIKGVEYAMNNCPFGNTYCVASMSLGGGASATMDAAVNNCANKGVPVVVAAGNSNAQASTASPARAAQAITVAASTDTNALASYTNYGSACHIIAGGSNVMSAWYTSDTAYNTISGTSMACPAVAGGVAVYLRLNTPAQGANLVTTVKSAISSFGTKNVINIGTKTGTPNVLLFDKWNKP